jgi:hypothetical protein
MALDAQSNWDVEMSQPFRVPPRQSSSYTIEAPSIKPSSESIAYVKTPTREILLPAEIIFQITSFIPLRSSQSTLWACTLVSRAWYASSIARLYNYPHITPTNFSSFVSTICPSKNARIRHTPLSALVLHLDMSELVHNSSRSLTARLLGRLKGNVEEFIAPQASFAINSFAALSKCVHLKVLDLSLVSTSIEMEQLFNTLATLKNLETLFFPRTSYGSNYWQGLPDEHSFAWPPELRALHLAGGIDDAFLRRQLIRAPQTLERLSIQHCSQIYSGALLECLQVLGPRLKHLTIRHPMPKLFPSCLDQVLGICHSLIALRISADYISHRLFETIPQSHPLRILDLDCSPTADANVELDPDVVFFAVEEGQLPDLRSVRVNARLAWTASKTVRRDAADLGDILEAAERERPLGVVAGVWVVSD